MAATAARHRINQLLHQLSACDRGGWVAPFAILLVGHDQQTPVDWSPGRIRPESKSTESSYVGNTNRLRLFSMIIPAVPGVFSFRPLLLATI